VPAACLPRPRPHSLAPQPGPKSQCQRPQSVLGPRVCSVRVPLSTGALVSVSASPLCTGALVPASESPSLLTPPSLCQVHPPEDCKLHPPPLPHYHPYPQHCAALAGGGDRRDRASLTAASHLAPSPAPGAACRGFPERYTPGGGVLGSSRVEGASGGEDGGKVSSSLSFSACTACASLARLVVDGRVFPTSSPGVPAPSLPLVSPALVLQPSPLPFPLYLNCSPRNF